MTSESLPREYDVIIVGAGPAGVAAAGRLRRSHCPELLVLERADRVGGVSSHYGEDAVHTFLQWTPPRLVSGRQYAQRLADRLEHWGAEVHIGSTVIAADLQSRTLTVISPRLGKYRVRARALMFACGARERTAAELSWLVSRRPARIYNAMPMLDLMRGGRAPRQTPLAFVSSRPTNYALAAKLASHSAVHQRPWLFDHASGPLCSLLTRLYFRRWTAPRRRGGLVEVVVEGDMAVTGVRVDPGEAAAAPAGYVVLGGNLVPNSELLAMAGVAIEGSTWQVKPAALESLAANGIFLAGNIRGGEHGAHWAYWDGWRVAGRIGRWLAGQAR